MPLSPSSESWTCDAHAVVASRRPPWLAHGMGLNRRSRRPVDGSGPARSNSGTLRGQKCDPPRDHAGTSRSRRDLRGVRVHRVLVGRARVPQRPAPIRTALRAASAQAPPDQDVKGYWGRDAARATDPRVLAAGPPPAVPGPLRARAGGRAWVRVTVSRQLPPCLGQVAPCPALRPRSSACPASRSALCSGLSTACRLTPRRRPVSARVRPRPTTAGPQPSHSPLAGAPPPAASALRRALAPEQPGQAVPARQAAQPLRRSRGHSTAAPLLLLPASPAQAAGARRRPRDTGRRAARRGRHRPTAGPGRPRAAP
jgi:hypothetical protein